MTEHQAGPREGDLPYPAIVDAMNAWIAKGYHVFIKWTCPLCGDRPMANEPDEFHTGGYVHEERHDGTPCGHLYTGGLYGLMAFKTDPTSEDLAEVGQPQRKGKGGEHGEA